MREHWVLGDYDAVVVGHICLDVIPNLAGIALPPGGNFETVFLPGLSWPIIPIRQAVRRYNGLSCDCQW